MKILTIRGKNLASLEGEFMLDFTREPLASAGIYAITGPTGSGKSTILDALCLALFARSPRQAAARESGVELRDGEAGSVTPGDCRTILRKGSTEGVAAVTFAGPGGTPWEAEWSVRRARNRPSGKLQDYALRLTNLATGQPWPGTKTEILRETERLVGLTYDQFTRSVLLAQGDFTAFLKAARDEKAALLEKITGTTIYSRISQSIFARSREAEASLKEIRDQLSGIALPAEEEIRALEEGGATLKAAITVLEQQKEKVRHGLEWHTQKEKWSLLAGEAREEVLAGEAALTEAAGREAHFRRVEKIQPARPLVTALQEKKEALRQKEKGLAETEARFTTLKDGMETLANRVTQAEHALEAAVRAAAAARPLLVKARELDTLLAEQNRQISKAGEERTLVFTQHSQAERLWREQEKERLSLCSEREALEGWFRERESRKNIAENGPLIVSRLQDALQYNKEAEGWNTSLGQAREKTGQLEQTRDQQAAQTLVKERESQELQRQSEEIREKMAAIPVDQLTATEKGETMEMLRLSSMRSCWERLQGLTTRKNEIEEERATLRSQLEKETEELNKCLEEGETLRIRRDQTGHLLEQARLAVAGDVEQLRQRLTPGEACPVCGSPHHPWAEEDPRLHHLLADLEKEHATLTMQWQEMVEKKARLTQSCTHHEAAIEKIILELEKGTLPLANTTAEWEQYAPGEELLLLTPGKRGAFLEMEMERHRLSALAAREALENHRTLSDLEHQLRKRHDEVKVEWEQIRGSLTETITSLRMLAVETEQAELLRGKSQEKYREALEGISSYFPQPGWEENWAMAPEAFSSKLLSFAGEWKTRSERLTVVIREEQVADAECRNRQERSVEMAHQLAQVDQKLQAAAEVMGATREARRQLFEGREAAAVETSLAQEEETCHLRLKGLRGEALQLQAETSETEGSLTQIRDDLKRLKEDTTDLTLQIGAWLLEFNTPEETPLTGEELDPLLAYPAEWITTERRALQKLHDDLLKARSTLAEREQQREAHLTAGREIADQATLETMMTETEELLQKRNGEMNDLRFRLRTYMENQKKAGDLARVLEEREGNAEKWKKLNELLGSADGKKFRQIAQEYTLEILLSYANVHLRELTSRYRLEVITDTLSLQVIDRDMGDEIRSVHSLSGGESFLVSLALALGLASLSSNRMTIESLFIDEGFGSLDPHTLGVAMDALERLRNQGRKVGVISHVQEMTERIPTQVRVIKRASGRSSVEVVSL